MPPTVIHVSPHPDDESIAAPSALLTLRDNGWTVINYAAGLGRRGDHVRRRAELDAALDIAGFEAQEAFGGRRSEDVPGISGGDDHRIACRALIADLSALVARTGADVIVGPHPRDGHHGHATVARAVREVVWAAPRPLQWWMWAVWSDLPRPTTVVNCSDDHRALSAKMLDCYAGENGRNDYRRMQDPMRVVNAVRGIEKVFGYGSSPCASAGTVEHAELLTEVTAVGKRWFVGEPRLLAATDPVRPVLDGELVSARWTPLDDMSILSGSRLRPLYHPRILSMFSKGAALSRALVWLAGSLARRTSGGTIGLRPFT